LLALFAGAVLLQEQVAQPLFETIDRVQHWMCGQIGGQAKLLIGTQSLNAFFKENQMAKMGANIASAGERPSGASG
jgi:hypothetical protein